MGVRIWSEYVVGLGIGRNKESVECIFKFSSEHLHDIGTTIELCRLTSSI